MVKTIIFGLTIGKLSVLINGFLQLPNFESLDLKSIDEINPLFPLFLLPPYATQPAGTISGVALARPCHHRRLSCHPCPSCRRRHGPGTAISRCHRSPRPPLLLGLLLRSAESRLPLSPSPTRQPRTLTSQKKN